MPTRESLEGIRPPLPAPGSCPFLSLFVSCLLMLARLRRTLLLPSFTSLLTHRLVLLCIDAHCFIFWDLPGDVLAAPESALWLDRCNTHSLSLSTVDNTNVTMYHHLISQAGWNRCNLSIYLSCACFTCRTHLPRAHTCTHMPAARTAAAFFHKM